MKLGVSFVSTSANMGGCGKNNPNFCGAKIKL